jgi:seryl-tRNA synthetase
VQILSEQAQTVDFKHYRSTLKNQDIINDIEKQLNGFQAKKYDVNKQIKAIEAFEAQAVKSAEETKSKVDAELQDLEKTLKNIETARPFEDLTVVCIGRKHICSAVQSRDLQWLTFWNRTKSSPPDQRLTSVLSNSSPRADGLCQATRFVIF